MGRKVLFIIILLSLWGCYIDYSFDGSPSFIVVNNYDQAIRYMTIGFLEPGFDFTYVFEKLNFTKGTSKKQYLERFDNPFNAEVTVWFGNEYDFNEYRFAPNETTVITLNENGILE